MTDFIDPTDIFCRLKPRARRRVTAADLAREYGNFRKTGFGAVAECYIIALGLFAAIVLAWRAFA